MKLRQPIWPRFLPTSVVLMAARLGPIGRMRRAPGTWGTAAGLFYQLLLFHNQHPLTVVLFTAAAVWMAVGICGEAEFRLGKRDPGEVVLDEFIVMPLCFLGWRAIEPALPNDTGPWLIYLLGFALFRVFDITKPLGISKLQDLPGGWGVVADDVAAALATCVVLHGGAALWLHYR